MPQPCAVQDFGWHPDLADHRDYSIDHKAVTALLGKLKLRGRKATKLPERVTWREFCAPVEDQKGLATSTAHACLALIQQLERRSSGRLVRLSRIFAHGAARRLQRSNGNSEISLRTMLKAIVRCGVPPEEYWPYEGDHLNSEPDAFVYSFQRDFRGLRYFRLDDRQSSGDEVLNRLKRALSAGFSFVLGFPVCNAVNENAEIPFPTVADAIVGGQAVVAVGYDDRMRIRSDKGAFLVQNSWGRDWGDEGFGWLPYSYVRWRLAVDCWTLLKPSWLRSGEFRHPQFVDER